MARKKTRLKVVSEKPKQECQVVPFTEQMALKILFRAYPKATVRFKKEYFYRPDTGREWGGQEDIYYWFRVDNGAIDYFTGGAWNSLEEAFKELIDTAGKMKRVCGMR